MSDLTDNGFYPSAERIWLCIRLNNAGKYYEIAECVQKLRTDFGRREAPSELRLFVILWKKWKKLVSSTIKQSMKSQKQCVHPRILLLWQKVCVKRHQYQLNISETSLRRIQFVQIEFNWFRSWSQLTIPCVFASLSGPAIDLQKMPIMAKKIIFSNEAHFDLGGYVKKQSCSIWGTENL